MSLEFKAVARGMASDIEAYARELGIKILTPGEPNPPAGPWEEELSTVLEERVAYLSLKLAKFGPLDMAKNNMHSRMRKFLANNKKNILYLREVGGIRVMDDVLGGCIKISAWFSGRAKQIAEDGTMLSTGG